MKKKGVVDFGEAAEKLRHSRAEIKLERIQDAFREARGGKKGEKKCEKKKEKERTKKNDLRPYSAFFYLGFSDQGFSDDVSGFES